MAAITVVKPGLASALLGLTTAHDGDTFQNDGETLLIVHNGGGGSINVTVTDQKSRSPREASSFSGNVVKAVAAGADRVIGPFPVRRFNNAVGNVVLGFSGVSSVTVTAVSTKGLS